ncbi:MAG TPA: PhoH family protein [Bdellovibrionota bacterium]|nr:PhoH family protein [Bdellovibrionota bacterium]
MQKKYILDTNVLLYDPRAIFKFKDNEVIIPIAVIEEIDHFKKDENETGRNARQLSRFLDELRERGSLAQGVSMDSGGTLRVHLGSDKKTPRLEQLFTKRQADMSILAAALDVKERSNGQPVIFLTKDTNLRIRADALGIVAMDYEPHVIAIDELYKGWRELVWTAGNIEQLVKLGEMPINGFDPHPNELFLVRGDGSCGQSVLARAMTHKGKMKILRDSKRPVWGIHPRNLEQSFALELLLDDSVKLVTLVGKAGTGKTLLAIAAGLQKVGDEQIYHRLLVSRPVFPMGRDLGFLPGDLEEKLLPWMQPIFDNIELLMGTSGKERRRGGNYGYKELLHMGMLAIEPLTYIRGRSIPNQYLLVDEAQNLTPHEIKTIITRSGENTKLVITGDPYQIDNPYVDSSNNGLTYVVERFKDESMAGHVTLAKGERSPLAELASNIL